MAVIEVNLVREVGALQDQLVSLLGLGELHLGPHHDLLQHSDCSQ